jgi:hypothetical protein
MPPRANDRCPLCGAYLAVAAVLGSCEELIDGERAIVAGRCPHCQGRFDVMIVPGRLDIGYVDRGNRFDVVLSLPSHGLVALLEAGGDWLAVSSEGRRYRFAYSD